ncbi:Tex family protein [Leptolyngbya iicbica]|uniref:RNA-binding transcriptional accessory protein n=2 Tax=Cyanophyceae TaxID=3028117 RepID=A0A4Q7E4Z7_9CYAN|nr:Tex family protein [Leptolyngbya sp. LK]RZM77373.1 RNA-binding transcriptional accessory protein [Leptolyngbya sp. LK]
MADLTQLLATELDLPARQIDAALALLNEGATVPFIARYRKERTGGMDEVQLRSLQERYAYLTELADRKQTILKSIADQGKLTKELEAKIRACTQKTELEDLYLPYKPKRRTRATIAKEKGLEPLADRLADHNRPDAPVLNLSQAAAEFVNPEAGVENTEDALKGAADILAEAVAERADLRAWVRDYLLKSGVFQSRIDDKIPAGSTKFELYRQYDNPVSKIAPHNLLALLRGQREDVLSLELAFDTDAVLRHLESSVIRTREPELRQFYQDLIQDAFARLMKTSLVNTVIAEKKAWADEESIQTFEANLRDLLLAPPAGMKPTIAIDPGFRTGCKVAVIDQTGQFLHYEAIFPHQVQAQREKAAATLAGLIQKYEVALIAIGNGTAGRETEAFVNEVLQPLSQKPTKVMVNEAGASVYSASEVAIAEFPNLDVTVRGAISIGRRLQDPLAELVKIDPKSIGVGQYQHDVDQKRLKQKLADTVESCVNYVGVDLNTASTELLTYVSGISATLANNIVQYRNENGAFRDRKALKKVPKLGPKAFEQAAGFLRIRGGDNPLDNTAVHPERYGIVAQILQDLQVNPKQLGTTQELQGLPLQQVNLKRYITDEVGEPTLRDILAELEKPGRDPRSQFVTAQFRDDIQTMADLQPGMSLEGVVTNVANFGAFVDIGVHQDGLVHISQLADRFVKDPKDIVKVGQVVTVRVMEVDEKLKRISLSMRSPDGDGSSQSRPSQKSGTAKPQSKKGRSGQGKSKAAPPNSTTTAAPTLQDLKAKFNKR